MRIIALGNGKRVSLGEYVRIWRRVRQAPSGTIYTESLCGWWPTTRETILAQFSAGVHDRINRHLPGYGVGRKWKPQWQSEMRRTARQVNTPRLRISWLPKELRGRFADRMEA